MFFQMLAAVGLVIIFFSRASAWHVVNFGHELHTRNRVGMLTGIETLGVCLFALGATIALLLAK